MTSPDPEIDGGLPWIRGVDPAAGTRPGSRQDPAQEPTPKPPGSRGGSDPATNLGTDFTEEKPALEPTSRQRSPAAWVGRRDGERTSRPFDTKGVGGSATGGRTCPTLTSGTRWKRPSK